MVSAGKVKATHQNEEAEKKQEQQLSNVAHVRRLYRVRSTVVDSHLWGLSGSPLGERHQ
jgi:hypothetical protein